MNETTRVKLRLRDGNVTELDVAEIIEVDGKPFIHQDESDSKLDTVIDSLNHTNGRVEAMQQMLNSLIQPALSTGT
jgi:hypothetical protein